MKKTKKFISEKMSFGQVLSKYPQTVEVFMGHGMHCFGCFAAQMETIEEGARAHGMNEEETKKLVEELNEIAGRKEKAKKIK